MTAASPDILPSPIPSTPIPSTPCLQPLFLSHGTLETRDVAAARRFYDAFLGLDTVRRNEQAVWIRAGGTWMIACVATGEAMLPQTIENRWCLELASPSAVHAAHAAAHRRREEFAIREIGEIEEQDGRPAFRLRDLDGNWWELAAGDFHAIERLFARGDVPHDRMTA